jgi:hypothetical protein
VTGPGVWRMRVRCAPGLGRSSVTLLVADPDVAAEPWSKCADVVLAGVHGSPGAAVAEVRLLAGRFPGAAAAVAWHREVVVFARTRTPAASSPVFVGEFTGSWVAEPGVEPPGFRAVLAGVLHVIVASFQLGQCDEDLGGVVRRIEAPHDVQSSE